MQYTLLTRKWQFSLHADGPRDNSVEHIILMLWRGHGTGTSLALGTTFSRLSTTQPFFSILGIFVRIAESNPFSRCRNISSEFSLHANGPRDNSVEHFILTRVLLTCRWPRCLLSSHIAPPGAIEALPGSLDAPGTV